MSVWMNEEDSGILEYRLEILEEQQNVRNGCNEIKASRS